MIKKITLIGCEFCHKPYTNEEAAELDYMCDQCPNGREERNYKLRIKAIQAELEAKQRAAEQEYSDWLATQTR